MNSFVILSVGLVLSTVGSHPATTKTRAVLGDTFISSGTVRIDIGNENITGEFTIARWQSKLLGLENETYPSLVTTTSRALLRYVTNSTYYIRGDVNNPHCYAEDRNFTGMPRFWEWLDKAQYIGTTTIQKIQYDFWGTTVGGMQFELGMPRDTTKRPYLFNRKSEVSVFYSFNNYQTLTEANAAKELKNIFDVPHFCKE